MKIDFENKNKIISYLSRKLKQTHDINIAPIELAEDIYLQFIKKQEETWHTAYGHGYSSGYSRAIKDKATN